MHERKPVYDAEQPQEAYTCKPVKARRFSVNLLEARVRELTCTVQGLQAAPYYACLAAPKQTCDATDELHTRVETLQWILRVAKHLSSKERDRVIMTACRSVDDLEIALQTRLQASVMHLAA